MLRWFYIVLGCGILASLIHLETVRATGREPGDLVGGLPEISMPELRLISDGAPIQVFLLADPAAVAGVRAAIAPQRIVAETPEGFALEEGRIVAAGHDATAALLTVTDWSDRPLEIHQAVPRLPDYQAQGRFAERRNPGDADLNALAKKSHLTQQEAMAVMNRLD